MKRAASVGSQPQGPGDELGRTRAPTPYEYVRLHVPGKLGRNVELEILL
ncbi:hypothetical protein EYF80_068371 [Liparis tanakae]|uniref:Uncharacterized protein n=1 Tax=Liparis tanakae TaxID=230148 RepID=A0A4Z2DYK4_9TELE|nr:hypothetical protein EYF80_068371 [Liparis tanakae]